MFGRNSGCGFFNNKCVTNGVSADPSLWCITNTDTICDTYRLNKGFCSIITYTSIPSYYQYFTQITLGGSDSLADFCLKRNSWANGSCRGNSLTTFTYTNADEYIGIKSRCFESKLNKSPSITTVIYNACYEVISCTSTNAVVKVGSITVNCPFTGGNIAVSGYTGTLVCPNSDILCREVPCINMCSGYGKCISGYCEYFSGYTGEDCSIKCSNNCLSCSSSSSCLTCATGFSLISNNCVF